MLPPQANPNGPLEATGEAQLVRLHTRPFAEGVLRYACHLFQTARQRKMHLVTQEGTYGGTSSNPESEHDLFMKNHRRAEELAKSFNEAINAAAPPQLRNREILATFVPAYLIKLSMDDEQVGFRYLTAERFIAGEFVKFNSSDGWVNTEVSANLLDLAAAYSHYSFDKTCGAQLCVDIQGVGQIWADPQFHSSDKSFGPADHGYTGMKRVCTTHRCNRFCCALQLRSVELGTLAFGKPVGHEAVLQERKLCLVCMDADREVACRPCGHLCLCRQCAEDPTMGRLCLICRQPTQCITLVRRDVPGAPPQTWVPGLAASSHGR